MTTTYITITVRIRSDLGDRLAEIAGSAGRTKTWIIGAALERYITCESQFLKSVRQGLNDLKCGRVVPHRELKADFKRRKQRSALQR